MAFGPAYQSAEGRAEAGNNGIKTRADFWTFYSCYFDSVSRHRGEEGRGVQEGFGANEMRWPLVMDAVPVCWGPGGAGRGAESSGWEFKSR